MEIMMLVDDVEMNNELLERMLCKYEECEEIMFVDANDGYLATKKYKQLIDSKYSVSCIFLDYEMPIKNGEETGIYLRQRGYKGKLFIITARDDLNFDGTEWCDKTFYKPLDKDKVLEIVNYLRS
jgi:DNA-binding LytR/AlgR family response regulator